MRGKSRTVAFMLAALLMLGLASTVSAQVSYRVGSTPVDVVFTGKTEVMGEVNLVKNNPPSGGAQTTVSSSISIQYRNVVISNPFSGTAFLGAVVNINGVPTATTTTSSGIELQGSGLFADPRIGIYMIGADKVGLSMPAGIVIPAEGLGQVDSRLFVNGVRADVTGITYPNGQVQAYLSSTIPNANSFTNVSDVTVARTAPDLLVDNTPKTYALCVQDETSPVVKVTEGFSGEFIDYRTTTIPGARKRYGANNNHWIQIKTSALIDGVDVEWPAVVDATIPAGSVPVGTVIQLVLVTPSSGIGDTILYEYQTNNQAASDSIVDVFNIVPTITFDVNSTVGTMTFQVELAPVHTSSSTHVPRFVEHLIPDPAATLIGINKCATYLLFPFLTNAVGSNFDSGVAIANTSKDNAAFGCPETGDDAICGAQPQFGPITLYAYPQGLAADPPLTATTPEVASGDTWAGSLSNIPGMAGFQGYVIAVAQFQYAHGFAFITGKYNNGTVFDVAEGYLALVIPDPSITGGRYASPADVAGDVTNHSSNSGENLGN